MKYWISFMALLCLLIPPSARGQDATESINLRRTVVVDVVQRTKDAVVNISAKKLVAQRVSPFGFNPFWEGNAGYTQWVPANSLGSGFIIHADGYVLTNNHVIDRASQITAELADGRKLPATLISTDPEADLAILKISDPKPLPVLELGDSSDLMIGEPVIAVGNPLGYSHTVSTGIVSALHRNLGSNGQGAAALADLIQTDAAINPGNSGGPLLNAYGQVIGINTAIREDAQNIGFAIQVNRLRDLIPELMNPAQANKVQISLHLKERRTISPPDHVAVELVSSDDPPRVLGTINNQRPANIIDAYAILLREKGGERLNVTWSNGKDDVFLAHAIPPAPVPEVIVNSRQKLGLTVAQITPALAAKYQLTTEDGLLITQVEPESVAGRIHLVPGDVILGLGRYPVKTLNDLAALMPRLPASGLVTITINRQGGVLYGSLVFGDAATAG